MADSNPKGRPGERDSRLPRREVYTRATVDSKNKKAGLPKGSGLGKVRRLPTLAQAIHALPSAMRCLTAEFGKGSGRATALWPP